MRARPRTTSQCSPRMPSLVFRGRGSDTVQPRCSSHAVSRVLYVSCLWLVLRAGCDSPCGGVAAASAHPDTGITRFGEVSACVSCEYRTLAPAPPSSIPTAHLGLAPPYPLPLVCNGGPADECEEVAMDLVIRPGPGVARGMVIPGSTLVERFSHSQGPGGQGVNTTDSRVELELDLTAYDGFSEAQRQRVLAALGPRASGGVLVVVAQEHRAQRRNRVAARERMAALVRAALAPPASARRATKPTRGSQVRRLEAKRQRSQLKVARGRPTESD